MSDPLALMPECALVCLSTAIIGSSCNATDRACTCADETLNQEASACIMSECTIPDQLTAANASYTSCGVEPSENHEFVPVLITFIIITAVVVFLRLLARFLVGMKLWWDDWVNFFAMAICVAYTILIIILKERGLGRDMWSIALDDISPLMRSNYILVILYVVARVAIRCSIVLFYLRIFQFDSARRWMWWTLGANIVVSTPLVLVGIFMCSPVSYFWNRWDGLHEGKCIHAEHFLWSGWIMLLVKDFWIMGVPLPFVARLQLSLYKKILVSAMFCMGLLVIGIGIYKLTLIHSYVNTTNPTYDQIPMATWVAIEIDMGVICACLPSLPILFRPIINRIRGKPMTMKTGYGGSASRYADISRTNATQRSHFKSWNAPNDDYDNGDHAIQMTTTIHQKTDGPSESETHLPIHQPPMVLDNNTGEVRAKAWA